MSWGVVADGGDDGDDGALRLADEPGQLCEVALVDVLSEGTRHRCDQTGVGSHPP